MIDTLLQVTDLDGQSLYLDLYDDVSVNLNMSFAEIQDITSKNSGYSQTFRVPGTPINNKFFNYMFNVNQEGLSFDIQQSVICSINYQGITVLDGILRLLKVIVTDNKVDYEVNIQDEVGVFINSISNKLLVDLDYTDLNHTYNATNVKLSWEGEYSGGTSTGGLKDGQIVYPFAHIGYIYNAQGQVVKVGSNASPLLELAGQVGSISNEATPMRTSGFKPSIQIYSVVKRIFNQNGYNIESEFFATEYFQRLMMPLMFNSDNYFINSTGGTDGTSTVSFFNQSEVEPQGFSYTGTTCRDIQGYVPVEYYVVNNGPEYPTGGWNFVNGRFYPWAGGLYKMSYTLKLTLPEYARVEDNFMSGTVYYYKNRTTKYNIIDFDTQDTIHSPWDATVADIDGTNIPMVPGDYLELVVQWFETSVAGGCGGSHTFSVPRIDPNISNVNVLDAPNIIVGSTLQVGDQFTDEYKQLDFLKGIVTQFNMVLVKHPYKTDTYIMEPYDDYVGQGYSLDWTDKLDKSKPIEISPITNMIGKGMNFQYQDDADSTNTFTKSINNNRTFGTNNFVPSGVTINDKAIEFVSFFSPSPCDILSYGGTPNPFIVPQFYGTKQVTVSGSTITELLPMRLKPRILHYYGLKATSNFWYFYDETTGLTEYYNQFPLLSHQNTIPSDPTVQAIDLNFGNSASPQDNWAPTTTEYTAFNLYYRNYIDELLSNDARMVTANFYLTIQDITNLQFRDLIFVKDAFYRINKISDFNIVNNKTTKVELVKLLNVDISAIEPVPPYDTCHLQSELEQNILAQNEYYIDTEQCGVNPTPIPDICYDFKSGYYNSGNGRPPTINPGAVPTSRIREIKYKNNKLYVGGSFRYYQASSFSTSGITQPNFSVINLDGSVNSSFINSGFTVSGVGVASIEVLSDDKILVGGSISAYGSISIGRMCRLNSDGTFDSSWNSGGTGFTGGDVFDIEVDGSNNIWVGGTFQTYNGTSSTGIIKLNSDGTINTSFGTNLTGQTGNIGVWDIQLLSDNSILCGGIFTGYTGTNANGLIKLNSDNTLNTTFTTNFNNITYRANIYGIGVQSTGKIILVGSFYNLTYPNNIGIIRINADGTLDNTFPIISSVTESVGANNLLVLSNDKFYVNLFYSDIVSGITYANYNRYNSDGTVDSSFTTNTFTNAFQNTASNENTCLIPNGDVVVGSCFNRLNSYPIYNIAAFSSTGNVKNCDFIGPPINPTTPTPTPTVTPTPTPTSVTPTPTPTGTPTPTPSSTPAPTPSYNIYTVDRYECDTPFGPCTFVETIVIANPSVLIGGKFYIDNIYGYIFNIVSAGGSGPYLITNMSGAGTNNCNSLCNL